MIQHTNQLRSTAVPLKNKQTRRGIEEIHTRHITWDGRRTNWSKHVLSCSISVYLFTTHTKYTLWKTTLANKSNKLCQRVPKETIVLWIVEPPRSKNARPKETKKKKTNMLKHRNTFKINWNSLQNVFSYFALFWSMGYILSEKCHRNW